MMPLLRLRVRKHWKSGADKLGLYGGGSGHQGAGRAFVPLPRFKVRKVRGGLQSWASAGSPWSLFHNNRATCLSGQGQNLNSSLSEVKAQIDPRSVRISKYQSWPAGDMIP